MGTPLTLLEMVQAACQELGLNAPERVVGSTDLQIIQLLLHRKIGRSLIALALCRFGG